MRPGDYPLDLYRGDSYHWQFILWADPAKTQPVDLTGVTAKAELRERPGGTTILPMVCTVSTNVVDVKLAATAWTSWTHAKGNWDLQLTYPDAAVVTILAGAVAVTGDVTDSTTVSAMARRTA